LHRVRTGDAPTARETRAKGAAGRWTTRLAILPIRLYRWLASPLIGPCCRYLPTCSDYAIEALSRHGALAGSWLAIRRVCRCHPWGGSGLDPVPEPEQRPWPARP
jgi:putative membrane protein insertion efficiency factor